MNDWRIIEGDCRESLRALPEQSVQACITSPPYFGLRDYGMDGQIGLEATVEEYVAGLVEVFRDVRRVLRDDGTLWLNLGDSYNAAYNGNRGESGSISAAADPARNAPERGLSTPTLKPKDLIGIPWRVAFALQADGWWLREDVIWAKPNPMPESVRDRCTRAHEYVFRLTKSARYFADMDAVRESATYAGPNGAQQSPYAQGFGRRNGDEERARQEAAALGRNKRSVWTVTTKPYAEAHFATFPPKLVEPMVRCASREGDTILDPFAGAGTTGLVALRHGRSFIGIELNPAYCELARNRIRDDTPMFNVPSEVA